MYTREERMDAFNERLVARDVTERPEAELAGIARIIGTRRERIVEECLRLLRNADAYSDMARGPNPFGDGHAAERIGAAISNWFGAKQPLLEPGDQFISSPPRSFCA